MSDEYEKRQRMQEEKPTPIVEDADLPDMDQGPSRPRRIRRSILRMSDQPGAEPDAMFAQTEAGMTQAGMNLMPPVSEELVTQDMQMEQAVGDQEKAPPAEPAEEAEERYVRLRLHVEQGEMTVVDVRTVEGPLGEPERIYGGMAYEVTRNQKRIGAGSIPDVGEMRSFPHPEGLPGMEGHHVSPMPSYEVNVRIPQKEFSQWSLPRLQFSVYRVKGSVPDQALSTESLGTQFSRELRPVAQMKGIRLENLSEKVQEQVRRALR